MHVIRQLHLPGVEWLAAPLHLWGCSAVQWLPLHRWQHQASLESVQHAPWWPNLWHHAHWSMGGLACHFLKVMAFLNIARWECAMVHIMVPSGSRNAKEMLNSGPITNGVGQVQWGCRIKCRSVHTGLHFISLSNSCSKKIISDSGSLVGTLLNVTLDSPVEGTKEAPGKGWIRI
jgi:hypothetical protein